MNEQFWWHLSRASGITSMVLLMAASLWGIAYATRLITVKSAPKWLLDLHRFLGGLTLVFVVIHIATLTADTYVHFGWTDVLVPFASSWKPAPVAWGIVAAYLLVAIELTSLAKKRMKQRHLARVHRLSFPAMWLGVVHGATAGSDSSNLIYVGAISALIAAATLGALYRVVKGRRARRPPAAGAGVPTPL